MDFERGYGAPPSDRYFADIAVQAQTVEDYVNRVLPLPITVKS
jgi:hypothetical protein